MIQISGEIFNSGRSSRLSQLRIISALFQHAKQYIHEDLAPWADGACFQTRALFSIWGLLQLIEFYPGLVPDIDMLFGCEDTPKVHKRTFIYRPQPPPVFRYCSNMNSFDIPFPDWSFWGWPELHIKSWDKELSEILKENSAMIWEKRQPTAFWRGNTNTGGKLRKDLQHCNAAKCSAEIIHQNWNNETNMRSEESKLAQQCKHRYKIYVEGWGWSVSLKYILACDSPVFLLSPNFYDFFSRGLTPMKHYWPIRTNKLCRSIKFASDWGNNNTVEAQAMGKAGNEFIRKELSMKHVYDYMLHLLLEYAKMLQFEPMPGKFAKEMCHESFMCQATSHIEKSVYEDSMVKSHSKSSPCFLPTRDENRIETSMQQHLDIKRMIAEAEDRGLFSQN
ncbi:hypothetical protein GOP47_0017899 [Adiantum capillus-veneris]|uniref:Glycosyl transferase CAP10 domain-containing protein n=1 Tax=Adiantum capillus-veneris TaxID=13818 RepID=A0A9D4UGA4_ADICA|nr:hypothetical protein GOP47_0017899 [Adiantum capillus-veneris]